MSDRETTPRRCDEISRRLSEQVDGGSPLDAGVQEHLARCARCAREAAELDALTRLFARDAVAPTERIAQARLQLRRALAHEATARSGAARSIVASKIFRPRWLPHWLPQAAGFALLFAAFVEFFPQLQRTCQPAPDGAVVATLSDSARELVASVGAWLPALPGWKLPAAPPDALRTWFGPLHSDAR